MKFVHNEEFEAPDAEKTILCDPPAGGSRGARKPSNGCPAYYAALYSYKVLTREQEAHYFRKYNYLKYRLSKRRNQRLHRMMIDTRNFLLQNNLRLVVNLAQKAVNNQQAVDLGEAISDGNMALLNAINGFDYSLGFKFSTYATWSIRRSFAKTIPGVYARMARFAPSETIEVEDYRATPSVEHQQHSEKRDGVRSLLSVLDEREQAVVIARYGLGEGTEPITLHDIGEKLGVSKERVRQLEGRALRKMRAANTA